MILKQSRLGPKWETPFRHESVIVSHAFHLDELC